MLQTSNKGFTLIELLVVITIIGILATGAVQVFTSQIQKARDTTRISDITALKGGVEQYYQDGGEYPEKWTTDFTWTEWVVLYVPKLPQDPKSGQASGNSVFDYMYNVSADSNTIQNQEFEVSAHFENAGNQSKKAATDGWDDAQRLEVWINTAWNATLVNWTGNGWGAVTWNSLGCVAPSWWAAASGNCSTAANPMVVKWNN